MVQDSRIVHRSVLRACAIATGISGLSSRSELVRARRPGSASLAIPAIRSMPDSVIREWAAQERAWLSFLFGV
jgi:hypothetical protein